MREHRAATETANHLAARRARAGIMVLVGAAGLAGGWSAKACAQLQLRGLPFECFIAGDGPEWHNLRSLIREYGLEDRVTLLGHVSRRYVNSWYDRADVVVLSHWVGNVCVASTPVALVDASDLIGLVVAALQEKVNVGRPQPSAPKPAQGRA